MTRIVEGKQVVIYGAAGGVGSAVARAFATEGAELHLAGRRRESLDAVAADLGGATVHVGEVDVLDAAAVVAHVAGVVERVGRIDVSVNFAEFDELQNVPLVEMNVDDFVRPVADRARATFLTATAAARHMITQRSGVVLTFTASAAREWRHQMGGLALPARRSRRSPGRSPPRSARPASGSRASARTSSRRAIPGSTTCPLTRDCGPTHSCAGCRGSTRCRGRSCTPRRTAPAR